MATIPITTIETLPPARRDGGHEARPGAPDDGRFVSKAEYWATYYNHPDVSYEWNDGYWEAKPLSTPLQYNVYLWFLSLLQQYLQVYQTGQLMGLETGLTMNIPDLKLPGRNKETVRKPNIAVIRHENPVPWGDADHSYAGICDLCIEVLSDSKKSEIERDTKTKKAEYALAGVQEYYILDPNDKHMHFYVRTAPGQYNEIAPDVDGIIQSTILPGFQFRLRDLHLLPTLETLALEPVYQGYVLLDYQQAVARADTEAAARRAAEAELALVKAELARLRAQLH